MRYAFGPTMPTSSSGTLIASSSGTVSLTPSAEGRTLNVIAFAPGMNDSPVHSATYYYDSGNRPNLGGEGQPGSQPSYDANGNLTSYKGWTYTYDAQNRLTSANDGTTSAEFYYDGKNRQIARRIGGVVRFSAWDNWELVEEYAGGMQRTEGCLQGATGVIKTLVSNIYYYQDKLGSTTHVANASGALLESYRYDLYGTPSYFSSTSQPLNSSTYNIVDLYAGERWIPELGLYDLRNRFMSPQLGRFLQPDPIGFKGDAANLYRYCGNDPIDKSDPTGLFDMWGYLRAWFFGMGKSFFESEQDRQENARKAELEKIQFNGVVNEAGLGGGNWRNTNVVDHGVEDKQMPSNQPGGTMYNAKATGQTDGSLAVHSELNWRVAKSVQNTAVVTAEINDHVRSYRVAETDKNGRIRAALNSFKAEPVQGTVAAAEKRLNDRLANAIKVERGMQNRDFHGNVFFHNKHAIDKNPGLLKPITAQDVENAVRSVPGF